MRKLILATLLLSGCVTEGQMQRTTADLNARLAQNHDPIRYEHSRRNGVDSVRTVLAGEVGRSGLTAEQQQGVLAHIASACGVSAESLKEVRLVEQGATSGYEVWVFDPQPRPGHWGTPVSVVYSYDPRIDVTSVRMKGSSKACNWPS